MPTATLEPSTDNRVAVSSVNNIKQYGLKCLRELTTDALKPVSVRLNVCLCGVDMTVDVYLDGSVRMAERMKTYRQFVEAEYQNLRTEYPDAAPAECREMAEGPSRRQDWVDQITQQMRKGTPTPQQWIALKKELGIEYICRRVFHDEPDSAARYLAAGLYLQPTKA